MINPSQARDLRFDLLRALAILGVVFIHAPLAGATKSAAPFGSLSQVFEAAGSVAVPVFLILSAFFGVRSLQKRSQNFGAFLKRRLGPLLLAFLVYSAFYWILSGDFSRSPSHILSRYFSGRGWLGQYFFLLLFQLLPFYPFLAKQKIGAPLVAFFAFLTPILYLLAAHFALSHPILLKIYDLPLFYWLIYPLFGAFLSQNPPFFARLEAIPLLFARVLLILAPFLIPLYNAIFPDAPAISPYLKPPVVFAALLVMLAAPAALKNFDGKIARVLASVGEYSLAVFCLNPLILLAIGWVLRPNAPDFSSFAPRALLTFAVVALSYGLGRVLERCGARVLVK